MKKFLCLLLAVLSTQGLKANIQGCFESSDCAVDCCPTWNFCDADFYVSADWLYWKARRCDLDVAVFGGTENLNIRSRVVPNQGNVVCIDHKYQSGVRVAAGLEWCSGWGFGVDYVYFNPCDRARAATTGTDNIITIARSPGVTAVGFPQAVAADFNLKLNQVDLVFTHKHGCNPCRDVHTFFGTRLAWIQDSLKTTYNGINNLAGTETYRFLLNEKTDLNAYGLIVGGQVFQDLWCSVGVYAKAGLGVLYGSYDQHSVTAFETNSTSANFVGYDLKDDCRCLISTVDLAFGLGVQGCEFCCATWTFIVGYEFHNWLSYRDYLRPLLDSTDTFDVFVRNKSDLGFDGLFVRLGVEF